MMGPGIRLFLLMGVLGGLVAGEVLARMLPDRGYPKAKVVLRSVMLAAAAMYLGALLTVSLTSKEKVLARGERLSFCGFYLDCHMGVAVEGVERRTTIGDARAQGVFYIVDLKVSSDARQATLRLEDPVITVVDDDGRSYPRAGQAEQDLVTLTGDTSPLVRPLQAGHSYVKKVVFDLPVGVKYPRLLVRDVKGVDRVLEGLLIGDEDSIFHRPTTLQLTAR